MARLEELKKGAVVKGVLPDGMTERECSQAEILSRAKNIAKVALALVGLVSARGTTKKENLELF